MDELQARAASWDSSIAHPARRYNYWLGGKDHFAADRASGDAIEKMYPTIRLTVVENRAFLRRVVELLAGEGVDQFLDIGAGLPAADNTHEVAQRINPASRVVYVDNDPMVMSHVRALLTSTPEGASCYLEHDLRRPDQILADAGLRDTLDLRRPVALLLMAVVHFIADDQQATDCVQQLLQALPPGSYVAMSHCTIEHAEEYREAYFEALAKGTTDAYPRSRSQLRDLLAGTTLLEPGIVPITHWRSPLPADDRPPLDQVAIYGAVARKD